MSNRYWLAGLRDDEVLNGVSRLVARGNALTADVLAHLVEVEVRMLYAELGFPSLFAYCVEALGMSEGAAGRRCLAARVGRRFPEVFELVARGELHLSAVCALAKHVQPENAAELFAVCCVRVGGGWIRSWRLVFRGRMRGSRSRADGRFSPRRPIATRCSSWRTGGCAI